LTLDDWSLSPEITETFNESYLGRAEGDPRNQRLIFVQRGEPKDYVYLAQFSRGKSHDKGDHLTVITFMKDTRRRINDFLGENKRRKDEALAGAGLESGENFNAGASDGSVAQSPRQRAGEAEARDFSVAGRGVLEQINALGRFTLEQATAYATLVDQFYQTLSTRMGVSVDELWQRYPLTAGEGGTSEAGFDHATIQRKSSHDQQGSSSAKASKPLPSSSELGLEYNQFAYHGSPNLFDKFTLNHIGSGEGAQVYGWGLYFAGERSVAEYYRKMLSHSALTYADGAQIDHDVLSENEQNAHMAALRLGLFEALSEFERGVQESEQRGREYSPGHYDRTHEGLVFLKKLSEGGGQLYKVNIPEDDVLLDWDKPLSKQPEKVRKVLESELKIYQKDKQASDRYMEDNFGNANASVIYRALAGKYSSKEASERLNAHGIPGLRYLDGNSRGKGEGSRNYVIFDDQSIEILERYYQRQTEEALGSFNPRTLAIRLESAANPLTFLHESGHFFLDMYEKVLARKAPIQQRARIHDDFFPFCAGRASRGRSRNGRHSPPKGSVRTTRNLLAGSRRISGKARPRRRS
jgi:hypothetical protein